MKFSKIKKTKNPALPSSSTTTTFKINYRRLQSQEERIIFVIKFHTQRKNSPREH